MAKTQFTQTSVILRKGRKGPRLENLKEVSVGRFISVSPRVWPRECWKILHDFLGRGGGWGEDNL